MGALCRYTTKPKSTANFGGELATPGHENRKERGLDLRGPREFFGQAKPVLKST